MLTLASSRLRCAGLRGWARSGGRAMPKKVGAAPVTAAARVLSGKGTSSGPVSAGRDGGVTIAVRAKPGARLSAVTDVTSEAVSVAIAAPPSEGEANAELCRYLSKVLEVKKNEVVLDKGAKSREKVVKILVSMTPDQVLEKLKKEASS